MAKKKVVRSKNNKKKCPPGRKSATGKSKSASDSTPIETKSQEGSTLSRKAVSHVDEHGIVELAWNFETGKPDFLVYDRCKRTVSRADSVKLDNEVLEPPSSFQGIMTPGCGIKGIVYVPSDAAKATVDCRSLRKRLKEFIEKYVQLPPETIEIAIEYILMTWVYDSFDEVCYLAFCTADSGSGKSGALEVVGKLCYRPIVCGGGSTAAAMIRVIHMNGGTLVWEMSPESLKL